MKELIGKLYPVVLPPLCVAIGVLGIVFFFVGPIGKGHWDILALGIIALLLGIIQTVVILVEFFKKKNK